MEGNPARRGGRGRLRCRRSSEEGGIGSRWWKSPAVLQPLSARLTDLFGQLHHVGIVIGSVAPVFQLLDSNGQVPFQGGKLSRSKRVGLAPPPEKLRLFVRIECGGSGFDFFQPAPVIKLLRQISCCRTPAAGGTAGEPALRCLFARHCNSRNSS